MALPTVGLTGGIASGKSTVASIFSELGVPIVDADRIAREVVAPGSDALREIVDAFGDRALAPDGTLDRKAVAAIVFDDPGARARLNAITHPRIAQESARQIAALQGSGAPYVIYEAALLVENGVHRMLDALVVVAVGEQTQLARLVARDGLSEAEAGARVRAQLPLADKIAAADYVIQNDGTVEETRGRTRDVHLALLERFRDRTEGNST